MKSETVMDLGTPRTRWVANQRPRSIRSRLSAIPVPYRLLSPAMVVLLAVTVFPLVYSLNLSFRDYNIAKPHLGTPFVGLANYGHVLGSGQFYNDLTVTLLFVIGSVGLSLPLGVALAAFLNRTLWGLPIVRALLLLPMITTPVVVGLIWRWLYNPELGVISYLLRLAGFNGQVWLTERRQALVAMIAADVWQWTPFVFLIVYAAMQSLPKDAYEAAQLDGASHWQMFWDVTFPLLVPTILVVALLRTLGAIKIFDLIFIVTAGGPGDATESLSLYVYKSIFAFGEMGVATAAAFVMLIMTIVLGKILFSVLVRREAAL